MHLRGVHSSAGAGLWWLGVEDVEAAFENEGVVAIELDGVETGLREDEADEVEVDFHGGMDVRELNLAVTSPMTWLDSSWVILSRRCSCPGLRE